MTCQFDDECNMDPEFWCIGLLPDSAKRGETPWLNLAMCTSHALRSKVRFADCFGTAKMDPDSFARGLQRRVNRIAEGLRDSVSREHLQALLCALGLFIATQTGIVE